ncbi:RYamide neuropeptides-like [Ostrinia nubilalis]|uniref:RYamide neuropeptides-like n=1 Tax=Ostrinia nubilalis TaxID=29057 RepID=UPI00308227F7
MSAPPPGARRALVCACAALLLCAARAAPASDKRAESEFMSPMPFVLGSRYGRSQPRLIAPRNDRFFMGSRYGKRSEAPLGPLPLAPPPPPRTLLCDYTGVFQLYRCSYTHHSYDNSNRRADDDRELGDDE